MISGAPGAGWLHTLKAKLAEFKCFDKGIDRANRIIFIDKIIEALRQQRPLAAIGSRDKTLHHHPPLAIARSLSDSTFSRSQDPELP